MIAGNQTDVVIRPYEPKDGIAAVKVMHAAYESISRGQEIWI